MLNAKRSKLNAKRLMLNAKRQMLNAKHLNAKCLTLNAKSWTLNAKCKTQTLNAERNAKRLTLNALGQCKVKWLTVIASPSTRKVQANKREKQEISEESAMSGHYVMAVRKRKP
jgi:hypothetical protein